MDTNVDPPIFSIDAPITVALGNNVRCKTGKTPKIQIKIMGDNFKNINAISLTLRFKTASLAVEKVVPALTMPEGLFYNVLKIDDEYSEFRAAWSSLTPFSLKNTNDLFCIYAKFLGVETDLIWITEGGRCEYATVVYTYEPNPEDPEGKPIKKAHVVVMNQDPVEKFFVNGKITNETELGALVPVVPL